VAAIRSTSPPDPQPLLTLRGIAKRFPGVVALDGVELSLYPGQVTALVGENGAGKSTLVKILTGLYVPDEGQIEVDGKEVTFASPREAWAAGITAIHQETVMFDDLSVAENIFMGHMPVAASGAVDWATIQARSKDLLKRIDADVAPTAPLRSLGVAQKHQVEIARALSHDSRIVIMDEPTAALSRHEIDDLYRIINQLKAEGRAILFISHKFDEIFAVADRWTVFRDGTHVGAGWIAEVDQATLVRLMVGRPVDQVFPKVPVKIGDEIMQVEGLSHPTEFDDISFTLRSGEILGFYGLVGAGRSEVMQALFGLTTPSRGRIRISGKSVLIRSPQDAIREGIAYVPEDRQMQGAVLPLGIRQNTTLAMVDKLTRGLFSAPTKERDVTRRLGQKLFVKAANWEQRLGDLSGGNQQKVVIAKWLATQPRILIVDEPTKGIDVGSKAAVHGFISELAAEGLAVILVSSELPEVMGMSDRIIVMQEGRIVAEVHRDRATPEAIVAAAAGLEGAHA